MAKRHVKKGSKNKKDIRIIIIMIIALIIAYIIGHITAGVTFGICYAAVLLLFLLIGRFLDSTKTKKKQRKIVNAVLIVLLVLMILATLAVGGFFVYIIMEAPTFDVSKLETKESSIFYDSEGNEIIKLGMGQYSENRENIEYKDLPEVLVDALVATEDSRFFQHNGFDAPRFAVALVGQLLGKDEAGGGSTLSMQVIKNSLTSRTTSGIQGIIRKFTDIYLAIFKLEKNFTKEEIIEFYINNHCLGNHACGVEQASQTYFGKSVNEINLAEAAMLVGMFQAPEGLNPYRYPEKTADRRSQVLSLMVRHGYITTEEAQLANSVPIEDMVVEKKSDNYAFQGYIDTVIEELETKYDINPYTTPVLVYTNMDRKKQAGVDDIFNGVTFKWANDNVQSGVAIVDADTGKLVAVGAGRNKDRVSGFNYATQANRQIGSTAKPLFDYAPGIEYLDWSTYKIFDDSPHTYSDGTKINNSDRKFMGNITMRTALSLSRNIPALKAFQEVSKKVGNDKILDFVTKLGIYADVQYGKLYEAHSVGAFTTNKGTTPLQMASAYAAFANGGYYQEATTVSKIVFRDNGDVTSANVEKVQVMSDATAFMITDMLKTSVQTGLANGVKMSGVNIAAKTGTTNYPQSIMSQYKLPAGTVNDAWVVGYDPDYVISMWYGYDDVTKGYNTSKQAGTWRSKLFKALGNVVFKKNNQDFKVPKSVRGVEIEIGSNPPLLASENTPEDQRTYEYFKAGTEPTETSTAYQKLETVKNFKVTYDEDNSIVKLSWSKLSAPDANKEYGDFGYNIYYNDVLLGFTTDNTYEIHANANIYGTYKVVTTFQNFSNNQSDPASYKLEKKEEVVNYTLSLNGGNKTVELNQTFTDIDNPITFSNTLVSASELSTMTTATLKKPDGTTETFAPGNKVTFIGNAEGDYTITYNVKYQGKDYSVNRKVTVISASE